jgi:hypothetical protein
MSRPGNHHLRVTKSLREGCHNTIRERAYIHEELHKYDVILIGLWKKGMSHVRDFYCVHGLKGEGNGE